jgi:hypothetical protein
MLLYKLESGNAFTLRKNRPDQMWPQSAIRFLKTHELRPERLKEYLKATLTLEKDDEQN